MLQELWFHGMVTITKRRTVLFVACYYFSSIWQKVVAKQVEECYKCNKGMVDACYRKRGKVYETVETHIVLRSGGTADSIPAPLAGNGRGAGRSADVDDGKCHVLSSVYRRACM